MELTNLKLTGVAIIDGGGGGGHKMIDSTREAEWFSQAVKLAAHLTWLDKTFRWEREIEFKLVWHTFESLWLEVRYRGREFGGLANKNSPTTRLVVSLLLSWLPAP